MASILKVSLLWRLVEVYLVENGTEAWDLPRQKKINADWHVYVCYLKLRIASASTRE